MRRFRYGNLQTLRALRQSRPVIAGKASRTSYSRSSRPLGGTVVANWWDTAQARLGSRVHSPGQTLRRVDFLPRHLIKLLPLVRWFEHPRLCAGTEDFHAWLEDSRFIERTSQNDRDSGHHIDIGDDA